MDVRAYLDRIAYSGPASPTLETLRALHRAHLLAVPFENLDIQRGVPIVLDEEKLFDKIVARQRGGFCYELNGLFAALLREIGFDVTLLSAGVWEPDHNRFAPDGDHLVLLVGLEERWLADVGFGDSFRDPLRLDDPDDQTEGNTAYRITREGDEWTMMERDGLGKRTGGYLFTLRRRTLHDFMFGSHYHQTHPDSPFTRKPFCTRATPAGRITLSGFRLVTVANGQRAERMLADDSEFHAVLKQHFGVVIAEPPFLPPLRD